ncbi:hypothetical protein D3C71_1612460 [compost metagenome]
MPNCAIPTARWRRCRSMPASSRTFQPAPISCGGASCASRPTTIRSAASTVACGTAPSRVAGPTIRRGYFSTSSPTTASAWAIAFRWTGWTSGACIRLQATAMSWSATAKAARSRASPAACTCRPVPRPIACCRTSPPCSVASASMRPARSWLRPICPRIRC